MPYLVLNCLGMSGQNIARYNVKLRYVFNLHVSSLAEQMDEP